MPSDEKLINYIKEHIKDYPFSKIEEKVLQAGYSKYQMQLALNDIIYPPPPKRTKIILISGVSALAVLIFAISLLHFMDISPHTPEKIPITALRPSGYSGNLGYNLVIPGGYSYISTPLNDTETLVIFPKETKPAEEEKNYAKTETIKVQVSKKQGITLENIRSKLEVRLKNQGAVFETKGIDLEYPNFEIKIASPYPLVRTFLEGKYLTYIFTSGKDSEVLQFMLKNLKDPQVMRLASAELPKLGSRTPTGFMTKKRFFIPLPDALDGVSVSNPYDSETEDVYFFPKSRQFEDVLGNAENIESGVIYLSITEGDFNRQLDILRYETDYKDMLDDSAARYRTEWLELPGAPALKIIHSAPVPHTEIVVFAKTEVYRLWVREETEIFKGLYRYLQTTLQGPSI